MINVMRNADQMEREDRKDTLGIPAQSGLGDLHFLITSSSSCTFVHDAHPQQHVIAVIELMYYRE